MAMKLPNDGLIKGTIMILEFRNRHFFKSIISSFYARV